MVVTALAWLFLALIAAIPLALSNHYASYLDALFECMSGLTTTGASVVVDIDHLSNADNMFRFMMHFIGGLGLIVVALSLGILGKGTSGLYTSEGRSEHVLPNIVNTTRLISRIAILMVGISAVIMTIICLIAGMEPVRAFLHALWISISGFMTAGFTPTSQSIMYYHSVPMEIICMFLMIMGTINFALFVEIWRGNPLAFFKDIEIRTAFIWLVIVVAVFMSSLASASAFSGLPEMLRRGIFMVISASTTTGFQVITNNQLTTVLSSGAMLMLAMLMAIGGSSGSTAGGMKLSRIGVIAKSVVATIKETLAPDSARVSVVYNHIEKKVLTSDVVKSAMTVSALFIMTFFIGSLAGIAHGYDALSAIFESISMASNGGLSSGIVSRGMPLSLELVYILEMWAGRLEFVALLALLVKLVVSILPTRPLRRDN